MKTIFPAFLVLFLSLQACSVNHTVLELTPQQSMCIAGKGPGQDAAINPYLDRKSKAIVENVGASTFSVRIQAKGSILEITDVLPDERRIFNLEEGHEIYFDSESMATAKVSFREG